MTMRILPMVMVALPTLVTLAALAAYGQTTGYTVEFDGAPAYGELFKQNLEIVRHKDDPDLGHDELERLVAITPQQMRDLLATEGFFSPAITHELIRRNGATIARFTVSTGTPTTISSVRIGFAGPLANVGATADIAGGTGDARLRMERLKRQWGMPAGATFRQKAWDDAKGNLLADLLNLDFPAARIVESEARIDPGRRDAQLRVGVDSGPAFTFGALEVQGLKRYPRSLIDRLNPVSPGERYSQEHLNELQARLQDSGYFKSAFATIAVDSAHPEQVPVQVEVNENERFNLALGVGFSTDAGPRGEVKWMDRQFLGRDWPLQVEAKLDRLSKAVGASFALEPLENGWTPGLSQRYAHTDIANALNDKLRTDARLTSPDRNNEQGWGLSYLVDRQQVPDTEPNNRHAFIGVYTLTRRRLDNQLFPTRGYVATLDLSAGPRGLNAKALARAVGQVTWLHPVSPRWSSVFRAQFGQVFGGTRDTVPDDLLFRTGGDQTVRGYAYQTLGVAQGDAIVGGTVLAVMSAELVYQVLPQWGAAVFTDAGNAADSWRGFHLAQGSGAGVRWRSPIGQVNVDLAINHETQKPRLHFSVGYGF